MTSDGIDRYGASGTAALLCCLLAIVFLLGSFAWASSIRDGTVRFQCETSVPCDPTEEEIERLGNDRRSTRMLIVLGGVVLGAASMVAATRLARSADRF